MMWHVHYQGKTRRLSADQLREHLSRQEIPAEALVWRPGMEAWLKAGDLELNRGQRASTKPSSNWAYLGLLVVVITASFFLRFRQTDIIDGAGALFGAAQTITVFGLMTGLVTLGALLLSISIWNYRASRRGSLPAGILLCIAVAISFFQSINSLSFLVTIRDTYRTLATIETWENAAIVPIDGGLRIRGPFGGRFMRDFRAMETTHGPVRMIEITSEGGLVDQALQLAHEVKENHTKVIVRGECMSACVLVAVATSESYADQNAVFGFHKIYPVVETETEISEYGIRLTSEEAKSFLKENGVPETILVAAEKHGPESVHVVTAREMVKIGAIKGILSGNTLLATGPKR